MLPMQLASIVGQYIGGEMEICGLERLGMMRMNRVRTGMRISYARLLIH